MNPKLNTMEKIRKNLKAESEDIELPMDPAFFDKLHDNIMSKIEETTIEPLTNFQAPKKFLRDHWRGWLYPTR